MSMSVEPITRPARELVGGDRIHVASRIHVVDHVVERAFGITSVYYGERGIHRMDAASDYAFTVGYEMRRRNAASSIRRAS